MADPVSRAPTGLSVPTLPRSTADVHDVGHSHGHRHEPVATRFEDLPDYSSLMPVLQQDASAEAREPAGRVVPGVNGLVGNGPSRVSTLPWVVALERGGTFRGPPSAAVAVYGSRGPEVGSLQAGFAKANVFNDPRYSTKIDNLYGNQTALGATKIAAELSKSLGEPVTLTNGVVDLKFVAALKKYEEGAASGKVPRNATLDAFIDGSARSAVARNASTHVRASEAPVAPTPTAPAPPPAVPAGPPAQAVVPPQTAPGSNVLQLPTQANVSAAFPGRPADVQARLQAIRQATKASPTIQAQLDFIEKNPKLPVRFHAGGESYFNGEGVVIGTRNVNLAAQGVSLAHETSHAQAWQKDAVPDPTKVSEEVFVAAVVGDEVNGEAVGARGFVELMMAGVTPDTQLESVQGYMVGFHTKMKELQERSPNMPKDQQFDLCHEAGKVEIAELHKAGAITGGVYLTDYAKSASEFWKQANAKKGAA